MGQGAKSIPVFFLTQTENVSKTHRGTCRNAGSVLTRIQKGEIKILNCYKQVGRMLTHERLRTSKNREWLRHLGVLKKLTASMRPVSPPTLSLVHLD